MIQKVRHVRTASYLLMVGIAVCIYCQAGAVTVLAQDNIASSSTPKIASSNASYNYALCAKAQNRDVMTETFDEDPKPPISLLAYEPPIAPSSSLSGDTLFAMINTARASSGLPAFERESALCSLAQQRAAEGYAEIFQTNSIHGGLYARNLPYWITENMKYGPSESDVFNWWMGSYIHHKAIFSQAKYACGACSGNTCVMEFTSYIAK